MPGLSEAEPRSHYLQEALPQRERELAGPGGSHGP